MRRNVVVFNALLVLVGLVTAAVRATAGPDSPPAVALSGTIEPQSDGTFLYSGTIRDIATAKILAAPQLRFSDGETATTTFGAEGNDPLTLSVSADREHGTATVDLSSARKGCTLTIHHVAFRLRE
jgi:hypothetical protein